MARMNLFHASCADQSWTYANCSGWDLYNARHKPKDRIFAFEFSMYNMFCLHNENVCDVVKCVEFSFIGIFC